MVTGTPFRIEKIRAGRQKPGLMRQHLTAVQAATQICNATAEGATIGSTQLAFTPGKVRGGEYIFSIGTAGSTTLVLQTILLPLLLAAEESHVVLEGGTHNPFAPPFDFLAKAYLPQINRMGPTVRATLERPGFFPAGGGRIVIDIEPTQHLNGVHVLERGEIRRRCARAASSNLPRHVAEREQKVFARRLGWPPEELEILVVDGSPGPGNIVTIELEYERVGEVFTGFGEPARPAEAVAMHAVQQYQKYIKNSAPVGEYLTDQLMLPLAIAGAGSFRTVGLSRHAQTHLELIREFLGPNVAQAEKVNDGVILKFGSKR